MKKQVILLIITVFVAVSCSNNKPSLQEYFVNNNDNPNFISLDIPSSILDVSKSSLSQQQKEAYESVKKLNVLAFKINGENKAEYEVEKNTVKEILKNEKYEDLMVINSGKHKGVVKYLGDDDAIDEVIVFGSDDENGFALIRILGNKMKPENMMTLVEAAQNGAVDASGIGKQLKGLFD
ncbi:MULTISPECIES: DUF4252 domain-containing protein [Galbibacter]|uniref:DUF4252 domain-containing protein n=1 Tax=Galbibacter pacificus TaxID=2996052 RepID=A0ABT6FP16_9FLAO|nr:DUF4252 domain-containing protein [Galbibacter pacificus]MDG3581538.1 DUF4252 domain-containing protein [Galbibacter pacificus]MDG3585016.1 DUF4252 domain-containing protein [Galbibacter pacificus]